VSLSDFVEAAVGIRAGLDFSAKLNIPGLSPPSEDNAGLPVEFFCDACHKIELDVSAGIRE
jgi:hypothetical protein